MSNSLTSLKAATMYVHHNGIYSKLVVPVACVSNATANLTSNITPDKTAIGLLYKLNSTSTQPQQNTRIATFLHNLVSSRKKNQDASNLTLEHFNNDYLLVIPQNETSAVRRATRMLQYAVKESDSKLKKFKQKLSVPKKAKRPIDFFQSEYHKSQKGSDKPFYEISKDARQAWKTMNAADKKKYEEMGEAEIARYDKEMADWRKKHRSPPKKARQTYSLYVQHMKKQDKVPVWKSLSEKEREVYRDMAAKDKQRYQNELISYNNWLREQQLSC